MTTAVLCDYLKFIVSECNKPIPNNIPQNYFSEFPTPGKLGANIVNITNTLLKSYFVTETPQLYNINELKLCSLCSGLRGMQGTRDVLTVVEIKSNEMLNTKIPSHCPSCSCKLQEESERLIAFVATFEQQFGESKFSRFTVTIRSVRFVARTILTFSSGNSNLLLHTDLNQYYNYLKSNQPHSILSILYARCQSPTPCQNNNFNFNYGNNNNNMNPTIQNFNIPSNVLFNPQIIENYSNHPTLDTPPFNNNVQLGYQQQLLLQQQQQQQQLLLQQQQQQQQQLQLQQQQKNQRKHQKQQKQHKQEGRPIVVQPQTLRNQKNGNNERRVGSDPRGDREGLPNLGNTCYLNTALIIIMKLINLSAYSNNKSQNMDDQKKAYDLYRCLAQLDSRNDAKSILDLVQYLRVNVNNIDYFQQSDCSEFLILLIREMESRMKEVLEDMRLEVCDFNYKSQQCGHSFADKRAIGSFYFISTGNNLRYDIDAFEEFIHPSKQIPCPQCRTSNNVNFRGTKTISKFPKFVMLLIPSPRQQHFSLKKKWRFSNSNSPRYDAQYGQLGNENIEYELSSFSIHNGTERSGHYRSVFRSSRGEWICLSDSHSSPYYFDSQGNLPSDDKITCMVFQKTSS